FVQFSRDLPIDLLPVLGGQGVLPEVAKIAATRDNVGIVDRFEQHGNARGLVLAVAIHRNQNVNAPLQRIGERRDECCAITPVLGVRNNLNISLLGQECRGAVGGAVVNDEDVRCMTTDFAEDVLDVPFFVVD